MPVGGPDRKVIGHSLERTIADAQVEEVIAKTLESNPDGATHWSTSGMAKAVGLSQTAIHRIWRSRGSWRADRTVDYSGV
jgi:hypothetical protein